MKYIIILLVLVLLVTGGLINSTSHKYKISYGSSVDSLNSTNHEYNIITGIPSSKDISSTNHIYDYGMLSQPAISYCSVTSGTGTILSQTGTNINVSMLFSNTGVNNITCNMIAVNGQCSYIATNVSYMTIPFSSINNLTACSILMVTNSSTDTRNINLYIGYAKTDWGKVINGATIVISMIGIYIGWKKISEVL